MDAARLKIKDLMKSVQKHLDSGAYLDTRHVFDRQRERSIARPEILFVLRNGHHEKRKDAYCEEHNEWNYAIRGKTVDERNLRIIVSFDTNDMLIITAIDMDVK